MIDVAVLAAARYARGRSGALLPMAAALVLTALYFYTATAAADGVLRVTVVERGSATPTAVRVRITDDDGQPISKPPLGALALPGEALGVPKEALAIMWGHDDHAGGYATQPDGAFYVDGPFEIRLPPGTYRIALSKGYEFVRQQHRVSVKAGSNLRERYELQRWVNMPELGWYSSDDHVHLRRSPRENPLILRWMAAEDIHVGNLLQMGDFHTRYFTQYAFGAAGRYEEGGRLLSSGQEDPRTPEIGHTISLGASQAVRVRPVDDYYAFDRTFDRVRMLGGVAGYAHQAMTFHGYRGMTLDVLRRKIDFIELLQFCAPGGPLITTHYYHFLDLGFPLTALAGSDFPWCGRNKEFGAAEDEGARIGDARFYTHVDGPLTFDGWLRGVKAGQTFVTSGPMLDLEVDGAFPGATLERKDGETLHVVVEARGHAVDVPLRDLELVVHGEVVKAVSAQEPGQSTERLRLTHDLRVGAHGFWIAARARGAATQAAHTTPVYVRVNGTGFENPATAQHYLELSESYLREIEAELAAPGTAVNDQLTRGRDGIVQRIAETRAILSGLEKRRANR
jgi:hypothetical protein